ncbi:hypothetical protein QBC34DRAFT_80771 [Podospora aff. communis PSN243]|uniref:Glycoside Hydrolase Family 61 n=1 Tax=Podospora aff. communis PSN243 TaxID=3040156 RepID=A0AAV9GP84_9PEZI|nr:hypothetical protein QBC34DRAFT_80771 [Podospora aff. communis PSN243]
MRLTTLQAAIGSASLFLSAQPVSATIAHRHAHEQLAARRHAHGHHHRDTANASTLEKRASCSLPSHPDLVPVPGAMNSGFAMAGDVACTDGKYCPYACVPGKVMAQWQPNSKYVYPESMNGGLECKNGVAEKPFPDKPYCVDGTGAVQVVNKVGKIVSFCQTVLPGDEAMVIPTDITNVRTIAVPGISYWDKTAAHYYINPPGVSASEGCVWGTESRPIGNWSPYVAGANTVDNGDTYVKIAWNPMFVGCSLKDTPPNFGIKIECPGGGCNGLPCAIHPTTDGTNGVNSPVKATGVGGANFCVVTVPSGKTANIVVFNVDGSEGGPAPEAPSSVAPPPPSSTKAAPTTTSTSSSSSSTSSASSDKSSDSSSAVSSSKPSVKGGYFPGGVFHENSTTSSEDHSSHGSTKAPTLNTSTAGAAPASTPSKSDGAVDQSGSAIAGLIVALVAAAALY